MTQDAICNLLSTAQEKANSLNSKLDPQLTQNYRELMIENWGLSIEYWKPLGTFCGSWLHFCGNDLFQASKTITKDKALDMHLHDTEAVCIF